MSFTSSSISSVAIVKKCSVIFQWFHAQMKLFFVKNPIYLLSHEYERSLALFFLITVFIIIIIISVWRKFFSFYFSLQAQKNEFSDCYCYYWCWQWRWRKIRNGNCISWFHIENSPPQKNNQFLFKNVIHILNSNNFFYLIFTSKNPPLLWTYVQWEEIPLNFSQKQFMCSTFLIIFNNLHIIYVRSIGFTCLNPLNK